MRTDGVSKTTNHVKKDARQETELEVNEGGGLLGKELRLGEVIWVKTNPSSWWPGHIVDAFTVSGTRIPKKREAGEVLVRLYGTYTYLYWNPKKYRGKLMEALKQNDGSSTKMFQKALQQEIVYTRSSSLKRKYSDHKEKAKDGDLSEKKLKQNKEDNIHKQDNSSTVPKVSTRELRTRKDKGQSGKQDGASSAQRDLSLGTRKEISKNEIPKQDGFRVGPRVLRPRKDLPLKLEDVRRTKMKANSGVLSSVLMDTTQALKQNDGSSTKMFQKALQQEIVYTRSSSLKRKYSDHKEKAKDGDPSDKKLKQNEDDGIHKPSTCEATLEAESSQYLTEGTTWAAIDTGNELIVVADGCVYCKKEYSGAGVEGKKRKSDCEGKKRKSDCEGKKRRTDLFADYSDVDDLQCQRYYAELYEVLRKKYDLTKAHDDYIKQYWNYRKDRVDRKTDVAKIYTFNQPGYQIISAASGNSGLITKIVNTIKESKTVTIDHCIATYRSICKEPKYTQGKLTCDFVFGTYEKGRKRFVKLEKGDKLSNIGNHHVHGAGAAFGKLILRDKYMPGMPIAEALLMGRDSLEASSVCRVSGGLLRACSLNKRTVSAKFAAESRVWC